MQVEYEIYKPNDSITFILTENRTIAKTNLQTFIIKYDHRNYSKQLERLRESIRLNQITSPVELIDFCNFRPGNNVKSQMYGLEIIPTKLERYVHV